MHFCCKLRQMNVNTMKYQIKYQTTPHQQNIHKTTFILNSYDTLEPFNAIMLKCCDTTM